MITAQHSAAVAAVQAGLPGAELIGTFDSAAPVRADQPRPVPSAVRFAAIARSQARRAEELVPVRQRVAEAIDRVGWRRARLVVEAALGVPVPRRSGLPWDRVGKRAGARILAGLAPAPAPPDLFSPCPSPAPPARDLGPAAVGMVPATIEKEVRVVPTTATNQDPVPTQESAEPAAPAPSRPATVVGNLTADPELRFSSAGKPWVTFSVAIDRPVTPGDWAGPRVTEFVEAVAFGSLAEHLADSLVKGDRVIVNGRPELRELPAKDDLPAKTLKRLIVDAAGPELRFATASVVRTARPSQVKAAPPTAPEDPWAALAAPADGEPPF